MILKIVMSIDMHGNIKALKYALGHELVYRDPAARLDRISKPVEPYRKVRVTIPHLLLTVIQFYFCHRKFKY